MKKISPLLAVIFFFAACGTSIQSIQENPQRYNDKDIKIKGSVIKVTAPPLVPADLLEVYDNTGKLLVLNFNKGEFEMNDKVNLEGRLYALNSKTMDQTLIAMEKKLIDIITKKTRINRIQAKNQAALLFKLLKGFLKDKVNLMVLLAY